MNGAKRLSFLLHIFQVAVLSVIVCLVAAPSMASPWAPNTSAVPVAGPGIPGPAAVPGKDFSHFADRDELALPAPEQVIAWDGLGGVRNSFNFSTSVRPPLAPLTPPPPPNWDVDAIANGGDALFDAVINDQAALLFSVGSAYPGVPSLGNNPPGPPPKVGDGLIYFNAAESFGPPPVEAGLWASTFPGPPPFFPPVNQIDNMTTPIDVDGLEVWGGDNNDDTNRYSLRDDPRADLNPIDGTPESKVAVWDYDPIGDVSTPHTLIRDLAESMALQLSGGSVDFDDLKFQLGEFMDVDAMMVNGERLIFSIAPLNLSHLPLPPFTLPDFDGGEIFVYDGPGTATQYLNQGGYIWNTQFNVALTFQNLGLPVFSENINALEAVAVPEPSSFALVLLLGMLGCFRRNRR